MTPRLETELRVAMTDATTDLDLSHDFADRVITGRRARRLQRLAVLATAVGVVGAVGLGSVVVGGAGVSGADLQPAAPRGSGAPTIPSQAATPRPSAGITGLPGSNQKALAIPGYSADQIEQIHKECGGSQRDVPPFTVRNVIGDKLGRVALLVGTHDTWTCAATKDKKLVEVYGPPGVGRQGRSVTWISAPLIIEDQNTQFQGVLPLRDPVIYREVYGGRVSRDVARVTVTGYQGRQAEASVVNGTFLVRMVHHMPTGYRPPPDDGTPIRKIDPYNYPTVLRVYRADGTLITTMSGLPQGDLHREPCRSDPSGKQVTGPTGGRDSRRVCPSAIPWP